MDSFISLCAGCCFLVFGGSIIGLTTSVSTFFFSVAAEDDPAGRFPAALALKPPRSIRVGEFVSSEPGDAGRDGFSGIGDMGRCEIEARVNVRELPSFGPVSEAVEDCELALLGNTGLLFEDATNFFPVVTRFFTGPFAERRTTGVSTAVLPEDCPSLTVSSSSADS